MDSIDELIKFDFVPLILCNSPTLGKDIKRAQELWHKVEAASEYPDLDATPKVQIDRLRLLIINELSNDGKKDEATNVNDATEDDATDDDEDDATEDNATDDDEDDATEDDASEDDATAIKMRRLGLRDAVFVGTRLSRPKLDLIPPYLLPSFRRCISKHRAAIPVPHDYVKTIKAKCLFRRRDLHRKFDRKWGEGTAESDQLGAVHISNPSGLQDTPPLTAVS
jgi:hypothetical protein